MAISSDFNSESIKGVLIDLDGTLINHMMVIFRCFKYAAETLDYTAPTLEQVTRAVGGSVPVTASKFFEEKDLEKAISLWHEKFEEIYLEDVQLMPGAISLLENLQSRGIAAAVFTNKSGRHSRGICDALGVSKYLKFTLGTEDTPFRKPFPEFSEIALEKLGVKAAEAVMIGDSPFDIEAGLVVGMTSFTVPTGSHTKEELISGGTHHVFENLQEIADQAFPKLCTS